MAWTYPINFDVGQLVTVAHMNTYHRDNMKDLYRLISIQDANLTKNNSSAFSDLSALSFAVLSGEVWCAQGWSYWNSNATADAKWTVTAPASSTGRFGIAGNGIPLTAGNETTFGNPVAVASSGTNNQTVAITVYITAGADGTVQWQAAQNTATVTDSVWYAGSFLIAHRIS